jgi:hypothetical protein
MRPGSLVRRQRSIHRSLRAAAAAMSASGAAESQHGSAGAGAPRLFGLGLGVLLLSVPMAGLPLAELQALNRELGRLCSDPPREALVVCRLHARLVRAL